MGQPGYGPLFKICPIIDSLTYIFQEVYTSEVDLTTVEAISALRGMYSSMCTWSNESKFSSYKKQHWNVYFYHATQQNTTLQQQIKNEGNTIYMDRQFSSPELFGYRWAQ